MTHLIFINQALIGMKMRETQKIADRQQDLFKIFLNRIWRRLFYSVYLNSSASKFNSFYITLDRPNLLTV